MHVVTFVCRGSSGDPLWIPRGSNGKMGDPGVFHYVKTEGSAETTHPFYNINREERGRRRQGGLLRAHGGADACPR